MTWTPIHENTKDIDSIEEADRPHAPPDLPQDADNDDQRLASDHRQLRITKRDLRRYGYTSHCPKCNLDKLNQDGRAQAFHHTERCRA